MVKEIRNAQITSTRLGEDHGCLTADIIIEGGAWGCRYGGYCHCGAKMDEVIL